MKNFGVKRIQRELKDLKTNKDPELGCQLDLEDNSMSNLAGQIAGPKGTPYEGGTYQLSFEIPNNYPYSPPYAKFITKVWHPNISSVTGTICLDILKDKWAASLTLRTVMLSIQALLSAPEPDDPQDAVVASQYKKDREKFNQTAQYWAHKYAGAQSSKLTVASYDGPVKKLVEMGFSEEDAIKSLSKTNFDVQAAINELS